MIGSRLYLPLDLFTTISSDTADVSAFRKEPLMAQIYIETHGAR